MCLRSARIWACDERPYFCTLFVLKTILERPIPFQNILSCFRTSFPVLEHPILFQNTLKMLKKIYQKCGCGCKVQSFQVGGAHTCACEVRACDPKSGRNSHQNCKKDQKVVHPVCILSNNNFLRLKEELSLKVSFFLTYI